MTREFSELEERIRIPGGRARKCNSRTASRIRRRQFGTVWWRLEDSQVQADRHLDHWQRAYCRSGRQARCAGVQRPVVDTRSLSATPERSPEADEITGD